MNSERLTLQDIVDLLAGKQGITKKDAETFIREYVALVSETIEKKDFVRVKDFGTFKLTTVKARRSVDVNTGDPIEIPAHYRLNFTPDKILREGVNKSFAHYESILLEDEVEFTEKSAEQGSSPSIAKPVKETPKVIVTEKKITPEEHKEGVKQLIKEDKVAAVPLEKEKSTGGRVEEKLTASNKVVADDFLTQGLKEKEPAKVVSKVTPPSLVKEHKAKPIEPIAKKYDIGDSYDSEYESNKKRRQKIWIGVTLIVALLITGGYWWISKQMTPKAVPIVENRNSSVVVEPEKDATPVIAPADSTLQPRDDDDATPTINVPVEQTPQTVESDPVVAPPVVDKPTSTSGEERVVSIRPGQTMSQLGKEYYGFDKFWVYIFEENRDKIKSPDAIEAGMEIRIAPASKYGIDPNDEASRKKATRHEMKLFGEFSNK